MLRLLSISLLSILLLAGSSAAVSNCFTQQGDSHSENSNRTQIVSAGLVCPVSQNYTCSIEGGGYLVESSSLNITTTDSIADIFGAVRQATNQSFGTSILGVVRNVTSSVSPGQYGYIGFTLIYDCYEGVLASDCFKNLDAGTAVKACQPMTLGSVDGLPGFQGIPSFVSTDAATASNLTTNPAAAKPSSLAESSTSAKSSSSAKPSNLAYRAEQSGGLLAFTMTGLVAALLSV